MNGERRVSLRGVVRAAWLFTGETLIERGGVAVEGGRVAAVLGPRDADPPGGPVIDLDRALVHPGLLNAHAHLDLTGLSIPEDLPFPEWLSRVRAYRERVGQEGLLHAAVAGARELAASGTTGVVDFSYGGLSEGALHASGLRGAVLREVIGPDPARAAETAGVAAAWLSSRPPGDRVRFGLAPHSPYLASGEVIAECRRLAPRGPFSIHAAELAGESELLRGGKGPLRAFLEGLGLPAETLAPRGAGPIEWLDALGVLSGTLLVHAGFLEEGDGDRIRRGGAAVVFCARSHRYFGRPPHPLPRLLEAGVPACLGTDSSASAGPLSTAEEMREARRAFPSLSPELIFALGTGRLLGARHAAPAAGAIAPGGPADLAAAELPRRRGPALLDFLEEPLPNVLTVVEGEVLHGGPSDARSG